MPKRRLTVLAILTPAALLLTLAMLILTGVWAPWRAPSKSDIDRAKQTALAVPKPGSQLRSDERLIFRDVFIPAGLELWVLVSCRGTETAIKIPLPAGDYIEASVEASFKQYVGTVEMDLWLFPTSRAYGIEHWLTRRRTGSRGVHLKALGRFKLARPTGDGEPRD